MCPDTICRAETREAKCGLGSTRTKWDDATYDLFMSYFTLPGSDEDFNIIVHKFRSVQT